MHQNTAPELPKTLYLLWLQGWAAPPEIVAQCRKSWEVHNPNWRIVLLDEGNLFDHIDARDFEGLPSDMSPATRSDVIRVHLLKRGGVWADASCFCCMPLDDWIHEQMSSGFFAFASPGKDRMISSWFLAATPQNRLVDIYCRATQQYWRNNPRLRPVEQSRRIPSLLAKRKIRRVMIERSWLWHSFFVKKILKVHSYFWFHFLFGHCYRRRRAFRAVWDATPKVSALIPHRLLHHGLTEPLTQAIRQEICRKFSPLYKLSWHSDGDLHPYCALEYLPQTLGAADPEYGTEPKKHYVTRSDTNRVIYFINPKCACTSLKAFVVSNDDQIDLDTEKIGQDGAFGGIDKTEEIADLGDYFKFSFVRNPWDRLVSCYAEKVIGQRRWEEIFGPDPSFEDFARKVAEVSDEDADMHWRSQYLNLVDQDGNLVVDSLGRVEEIEAGVRSIASHTGLEYNLGHYRKSARKPYTAYYDTETRELVGRRYAVDIAMFGYTFDEGADQPMHYQAARLLGTTNRRR